MTEWKALCPSGAKKFDKMKDKDKTNLYDFVWKFIDNLFWDLP